MNTPNTPVLAGLETGSARSRMRGQDSLAIAAIVILVAPWIELLWLLSRIRNF